MSEQSAQLQRRGKHWRQHGTKKNGRIGNERRKKFFFFMKEKIGTLERSKRSIFYQTITDNNFQ